MTGGNEIPCVSGEPSHSDRRVLLCVEQQQQPPHRKRCTAACRHLLSCFTVRPECSPIQIFGDRIGTCILTAQVLVYRNEFNLYQRNDLYQVVNVFVMLHSALIHNDTNIVIFAPGQKVRGRS